MHTQENRRGHASLVTYLGLLRCHVALFHAGSTALFILQNDQAELPPLMGHIQRTRPANGEGVFLKFRMRRGWFVKILRSKIAENIEISNFLRAHKLKLEVIIDRDSIYKY